VYLWGNVVTTIVDIFWAVVMAVIVIWVWDIAKNLYLRHRSHAALVAAPDWGALMQEAAELHMAAVNDAYFREEEGEQGVESPAVAPFDGCDTCMTREILAGAWPVIVEMVNYHHHNRLELHPQKTMSS
jgi:hypothetical protein